MNRTRRIALALGLAGIAAFLGALLALHLNTGHVPNAVRVAAGEASQGPALLDSSDEPAPGLQSGPKIPAQLPNFRLNDLKGRAVSATRWKGRSLMINFWATWCAPCRQEIPLLQTISTEQGAHGTQVVGIAVDYPDKVAQFAHQFGITYPLLVGEQDALDLATQLGVATPAFPFTVFTDKRGAIVALYLGELKRPNVDQILQVVARLNQDGLDLPAAQRQIATLLAAEREK